jgi:hypothetical protein
VYRVKIHAMPLGAALQDLANQSGWLCPWFRRRGYEATLVALFYAVVAWIVMHAAIVVVGNDHPNYYDPVVIIGGFMSHFFFTIPLALVVKHKLADRR